MKSCAGNGQLYKWEGGNTQGNQILYKWYMKLHKDVKENTKIQTRQMVSQQSNSLTQVHKTMEQRQKEMQE